MKTDSSKPQFDALPTAFACRMDSMATICVSGDEKYSYLQGQLTCDLDTLNERMLLSGAHCDAKGKVFSVFRLFEHNDEVMMLMSKESAQASLVQLQKFAVFAKAELAISECGVLALAGTDIANVLTSQIGDLPSEKTPVITHQDLTLVYVSGRHDSYLLAGPEASLDKFLTRLELPVYSGCVWNLLEILNGFPHLSDSAIGEYVPQMLNVQALGGISFTKGCYMGQETVARMKYLGKNKRAMFTLQGQSNELVDSSSLLEKQLGDNWRRGGNITSLYQADNGELYIQAVLANDTDVDDIFRIKDLADTVLTQIPLPYDLTDE
ncbi:tRNA-modifying protein YgfZ [Thalassotalea sp. PS06]|uniref:tRNA-modifying protein YgfZ n=1 Tax=Thalassotalea sp. PS06 TaxID=2594005 RepID=UPI00116485D4|nr:tRNA-modifying protein YgfZ [Thalassotalea sp. PS06]QDP02021.1 tRNA-modifying protein YgfZ [Thalassotalea sp. PS06]